MSIKGSLVRFFFSCDYIKSYMLNFEDLLNLSRFRKVNKLGQQVENWKKKKRLKIISAAKNLSDKSFEISIVVPVFNSEKTIGKVIESIQNQSYQDWELLLVDDGSTDDSLKIINQFSKQDSRLKVFSNSINKGVAYTRNVGLYHAKGNYITFHDADDTSHPERLEYLLSGLLNNQKMKLIYSQYVRINTNGDQYLINGRSKRNHISGLMIPRDVFIKVGYFKTLKISEDSEYHERIIATYGKQPRKIICKTLYFALVNPDSLLFSNANVSIKNTSLNYQINKKEQMILEEQRLLHKRIKSGELSPYQGFILDE